MSKTAAQLDREIQQCCGARKSQHARTAVALDRVGYQLLAVEIDVDADRARVEVRRHDGYTLTLDVRRGVATITREMQRRETVTVGRRGDRFLANRLSMQFLGRTRVTGDVRAALQAFAETIADNSTPAILKSPQRGEVKCLARSHV